MVEQESISGILSEPGHSSFASPPIGEYLRRQRVLRGVSAEELSQLTRIPLRSIERLESGQFDGETDGFVRGFVRTVAQALGLDVDDVISRMLTEPVSGARDRHHAARRSFTLVLAASAFIVLLALLSLGLRAVWQLSFADGSAPSTRDVVVWRDPVHALAEATGSTKPETGHSVERQGRPSGRMAGPAEGAP
jgi:transcriptional regulator with XRE-family HTH domain